MGKPVRKLAIIAAQALVCFFIAQYWTLPTTHGQDCDGTCSASYGDATSACNVGETNGTCKGACATQCNSDAEGAFSSCSSACGEEGGADPRRANCDHVCAIGNLECIARANPENTTALNACGTTYGTCITDCVGE